MRNTKQKELILNIVNDSYEHLTAQEVYVKARTSIENISLATVYRILNSLVEKKKIMRISTSSGIDHYDTQQRPKHNHFICNKCGKITDVHNAAYSYNNEELNGYEIDDICITFTGICNKCREEQ